MQLPNPNYRHQNNPQQPNLVQAPQQSGSQQQQQPPYQMNQPSPPIPSAGAPPAFPGGPPLPPTSSINQNQSVMNSSANYQQQALNAPAYQPAPPSPGKGFPQQQQSYSQPQAQPQFVQPLPQLQPPPPWTPNYQQQERQVLYNQQQQGSFPSSDQSGPKEFHSQPQSTAPPPPHHTTRGGRSNSIVPGHGLPAHDYGIQQQQQLQPRAPPPPWTPPSSSAFAGRRLYDQSNPHQGEQLQQQQQQGNSSQQQQQQPHQTVPSLNPSYPTAPTIGAAGTQTSSPGGSGPVPATTATTSSILQSEQQPPPPPTITNVGGGGGSGEQPAAVTVGLPHGGGLAPGSWLQSQQPSLPTQQTPTSGAAILSAQESGRASSSQQSGKQQANKGRGSTHKVSVAGRKTARQQQPPTPTGEESSESELPASPLISLIPTQAGEGGGGDSSKTPAKTSIINTTAMLRPAPVLVDGILDRSMIILVKRKPKEEGHHHPPPSSGGHPLGRRRVSSSHDGGKGRSGTSTTTTSTAPPPQTRSPSAPLQETLTPAQLIYLLDGTLKGKGRMGGEGRSTRSLIQDVIVLSPVTDMKLRTQLVLADLVEEGVSQSEKEVIATNTDLAIGLVIFNERRDAKQVCTPIEEEEEEEATAITPTTPDLLFEGSSTKERSSKVFHSSVIDEEVIAVFRALSNNPQHQEVLQNLSKLFSYPSTPTTASSTASTLLANCLGEDLGSNEQAVLRQIEAGEVDRRTLWEQQPVEYLKGSFLPQEGQTADEVRMILDPTLPALKDRDMATRCQVWEESKGKECPVTWKQEECPFRHIVKKETFKRLPFTVCKFSARGIPCKMSGCEFFHGTKEQLEIERSRKLTAQEVRSLGFPVPPLPAHFLEMGARPRPEQYFYRPGLYMLLDHPLVNYPNTISRQDRFLDILRSCPPFVPRAMLGWQTRWSSSSSAKPTAERQYSNNSAMASVSSIVSVAGVGASSHAGGSSATGSSAAFGGGVGVHHTHPVSPQQHSSLGQPPSLQDSPSILQQPHQRSPPLQRVMSVGGGASGPQLQPNQMQQVDHPAELAPSSLFSPPLPRVGGDEEDSQSSSSSVNNPPRAGDSAASTEGEQQHSRRPPLKKSTTYTHSPYALTSHLLVGRTEQSQQSGGGGAGSSSVSSSASVSSSSVVQGDQAVGYPQRPASAPARGRGGGGSSGSSLTVLARPPSSTSGGTTRTSDEYSGFSSQEEEEEEEEE